MRYRITTAGHHGTRQAARVKTYGEILREYEFHLESKCADADGKPCSKQTIGLLQRRHIRVGQESNNSVPVTVILKFSLIPSGNEVYEELKNPGEEWILGRAKVSEPLAKVVPFLTMASKEQHPIQLPSFVVPTVRFGFCGALDCISLLCTSKAPSTCAKPVALSDHVHRN
jgi:hypothetical protein